jgi:hypothetical protein
MDTTRRTRGRPRKPAAVTHLIAVESPPGRPVTTLSLSLHAQAEARASVDLWVSRHGPFTAPVRKPRLQPSSTDGEGKASQDVQLPAATPREEPQA